MHKQNMKKLRHLTLLICIIAICVSSGCKKNRDSHQNTQHQHQTATTDVLENQPIADSKAQLLDYAYEVAGLIRVYPHIKVRSKVQQQVVETALELQQPQRALRYTEGIENWRKGWSYAALAHYCARQGAINQAKKYLPLAEEIAAQDHKQKWRNDRIKIKIAQARLLLGENVGPMDFEESETGKLAGTEATEYSDETFDKQMAELQKLVARGHFDITKNVLTAYVNLFDRFYDHEQRRDLLEEKIKAAFKSMPIITRIEMIRDMSQAAADHQDSQKALELVDEAYALVEGYRWRLEDRIGLTAQLAAQTHKAGNSQRAKSLADDAWTLFEQQGREIIDMYRADALRPLAEAYQSMGDTDKSLSVYKRAMEEAMANAALRPRAEDISANCCSMALADVEPDAELWTRLQQIKEELEQP